MSTITDAIDRFTASLISETTNIVKWRDGADLRGGHCLAATLADGRELEVVVADYARGLSAAFRVDGEADFTARAPTLDEGTLDWALSGARQYVAYVAKRAQERRDERTYRAAQAAHAAQASQSPFWWLR